MTTVSGLRGEPVGTRAGPWRRFGGRLFSGLATVWGAVTGLALALFAAMFTFSTVVLGPVVASGDEIGSAPTTGHVRSAT